MSRYSNVKVGVKLKRLQEQHMKKVLEDMPKLFFVEDFGMDRYRVGRTDWPGDMFELVPRKDFDAFRRIYQNLNMPLMIVNDDNSMEQAPSLD